jgi:hypothetical protein
MKKFLLSQIFLLIISLCNISFADDEVVEVNLVIKDHKFIPEVLILPEGKKITLIVDNQDSTIEEFESIDLKREKVIFANSKAKIILAPLKTGEYHFFGEFHEETARGKLIITKENDENV